MPDFPLPVLPLTPSFVADAIAPAANNRYSVPCESSYPSQNGRNYQKMVVSTVFIYVTGCKFVEFVQFVERVYPVWDCFWDCFRCLTAHNRTSALSHFLIYLFIAARIYVLFENESLFDSINFYK